MLKVLAVLAIVLFTYGCEKKKSEYLPTSQELRLNMKSEPLSLDPRKPNDTVSNTFIKLCFDALTRMGLDGTPQLSVAEKIDVSEDQKTYTAYLRQTFWSDGHPVTAYDFETSWKTILDPAFPAEAASDLFVLKNGRAAKMKKCSVDEVGVKALDASTLRIDLDHPIPTFLSMLSTLCFFPTPSHIVFEHPEWADKNSPYYVTNGPFSLKQWRQADKMVLEKNPSYWDATHVKLECIHFFIIEEEMTELSMFENDELDWAGSPLSSLPTDAMSSLAHKQTYSMAGTYYYVLNTKDPLLKNANLRRALALSINRKDIVTNITQGGQPVATSYIPPALIEEKNFFKDADVSEAQRHLQLALSQLNLSGLPTLVLSYNTLNAHHKVAQAIQGQWRDALGIRVRLDNKEWKVYLDDQRHHQFQIARMGGIANNYDPISFLDRFRYLSSDENFSQWTNPTFTELLEKADSTVDKKERDALFLQAETILMDEMPVIPIYFYTGTYLRKHYVKDVYLSELCDIDFKWAYVEVK